MIEKIKLLKKNDFKNEFKFLKRYYFMNLICNFSSIKYFE